MAGLAAKVKEVNWRRWRPLALILAGGLAAIVVVALTVGPSGPSQSLGPLAGYVWRGSTSSVHASWIVPRVTGSALGQAGTWIGAQDLVQSPDGPFIQVGTNEVREPVPPSAGEANRHIVLDRYYAFWSDTTLHFHPHFLFVVFPGDQMTATLRREPVGWKVSIADDDLTGAGATASFTTSQENSNRFDSALWLQEDITDARTNRPGPYPDLSTVGFADLTVNGRPPPYADLYSQWMSPGLRSGLAPTPLDADAFSLHEQVLNAQAAHYLALTRSPNATATRIEPRVLAWSDETPRGQIRSDCTALASAVRSVDTGLKGHQWPAGAQAAVAALERDGAAEYRLLQSPPAPTAAALASWRGEFARAGADVGDAAHLVRRALGAPEMTPYGQ